MSRTDTAVPPAPSAVARRLDAWRPRLLRPVLVANLVAQIGIVVTGGAVRLTGSGLGCSTWPQCEPGQFTPRFHQASSIHPYIEFGNRTMTGVLGLVALAVVLMVCTDRGRATGYRWLGGVPLLGVVAQAVLGGITVLVDLHPAVVSGHFLVSMVLVVASAALLHRSAEGDGAPVPVVTPTARRWAPVLAAAAAVVLVLGAVTTGAGPHSGDEEVGYRFAVDPLLMSRLHSGAVLAFVAVLVVLLVLTRGAPTVARRRGWLLVAVVAAQGAVGYSQVATDLPVALVLVHMLGTGLFTAGVTRYLLSLRVRD